MALAIISPTSASPLAEMVPTWAISSFVLTFLEWSLLDLFDDLGDGLVDAALQVHRVHAGGDRLQAFAHDGLGQNGGGGGAVAGLSLVLEATSRIIWAPMFSKLVFQFDFLGDRHAVLGRARGAEGLLDDDVAALGAQRHLHGVGEDVDAAQHRSRASAPK
jgi:hypothetical protein